MSAIHPDDYKRVPVCTSCGKRAGWRIEQRQYAKRDRCYCSGYHYPHYKKSKFCVQHPEGIYNQAKRQGVPDDDIPLEHIGREVKDDELCPF